MLLNFRPEFHAEWMQASWYRQIPLAPLGAEAIRDLLADRLGDDVSLAPLVSLIDSRTKGNPFFVEEIVQSLTETGQLQGARGAYRLVAPISDLKVPATVRVFWPRGSTGWRIATNSCSRPHRSSARTLQSRCWRPSPASMPEPSTPP